MMYRAEAEHAQLLAHQSQQAASQFFGTPQAPMYPYGMPMHPEVTQHLQRMGNTNGFPMMPFPSYPMLDQTQLPLMMQMPQAGVGYVHAEEHAGMLPMDADRPDAVFDDAWERLRSEEPDHGRDANMDELLALSRQAQLEAGGNLNLFVCPHCEKRYVGKHARSIWRRHLQDKHNIPLSVQPRRTRWDRDANRPRNAEERRERMLESKRRWARKKREQDRRLAHGDLDPEQASAASDTPAPEEVPMPRPASPKALPTPKRPALAVRDTNVRPTRLELAKSPLVEKAPAPVLHSTPLREWPANALAASPENTLEPKKRVAAPASLTKRSALDRAALASFSRVDPSPRVFTHSASKRDARLAYSDLLGSPTAPSMKRSNDQFSSPQHLNLTHSLGLAPHSASKNGGMSSMYSGISLTPMQGGITPYTKGPLGLTPTIGGLLRGDMMPNVGASNVGDLSLSSYVNYTALDTPSVDIARSARRRARHADASFHSSSEREEEDLDQEHDQRNASPSIRSRVRASSKPLAHDTPSKMPPMLRASKLPTPRSPWQRTPHARRFR